MKVLLSLVFCVLLASAAVLPNAPEAPALPSQQVGTTKSKYKTIQATSNAYYTLDFAGYADRSTTSCFSQQGYQTAFVRAYTPAGNGAYDPYGAQTIHQACTCIIFEVYMTPQPLSTKPGYTQFDEMYSGLRNSGISMTSAWVQVVSPSHWSTNTQSNIAFVQSILSRMRQYGVKPGVYTNQHDWQAITGNWAGAGQDVMLWYANVNGNGPSGETPANFGDYQQIGAWQFPTGKQFAQVESVCNVSPVNRNIFVSPSPNVLEYLDTLKELEAKGEKPKEIVVGHLWKSLDH